MRSIRLLTGVCVALTLGSCAAGSAQSAPAQTASTATTSSSPATSSATQKSGPATQNSGSATKNCSYPAAGTAAKPVTPPPAAEPDTGSVTATMTLPGGTVTMTLDRAATPCTVGSFVHLAQARYFDGTACHRLTTGPGLDVLQCGDPTGTGTGGPGYQFADETDPGMTYPAGTLAMANSGPDSNGSQFFLVYADSQLQPNYTVFGHITGGLDVVTGIARGGVRGGGGDGPPASPATIVTMTIAG